MSEHVSVTHRRTLFDLGGRWHRVKRCDGRARALADRHYSRQTVGAQEFTGPGRVLVMLTDCGRGVWAAVEALDPVGALRWRVTIFRNEGAGLSSDLIREATGRTVSYWRRRYGGVPPVPLTTEVNAAKTRRKRDPGRCFIRAGWTPVGVVNGLHVLRAPEATGE